MYEVANDVSITFAWAGGLEEFAVPAGTWDPTDEMEAEAFRRLEDNGLAVRVGEGAPRLNLTPPEGAPSAPEPKE